MLGDHLSELVKTKLGIDELELIPWDIYKDHSLVVFPLDDQLEAREVGEKAAQFAIWHNIDGSITINRTGILFC